MATKNKRGKWVARKMVDGERVWLGEFSTKREALDAERSVRKESIGCMSCAELVEYWLREYPRPKDSTNIVNRERTRAFAKRFSDRAAADLSRAEVREWVMVAKRQSDVPALRAMFSDAIFFEFGGCTKNPFAELRLPTRKGRKNIEVISAEKVGELIAIAHSLYDKDAPCVPALVALAAYSGMRPGEIYALRWDAVRFDSNEIDIKSQYSSKARKETLPKNGRRRTVCLLPVARDELLKLGVGDPTGHVFTTSGGRNFYSTSFYYYWQVIRGTAGLPGMDFYELRHFCATYMMDSLRLAPHEIAEQLGHTDGGKLVMELYGHPSAKLARENIQRAAYGTNLRVLAG